MMMAQPIPESVGGRYSSVKTKETTLLTALQDHHGYSVIDAKFDTNII